jgi:hypothetical protein
MKLNLSELNTLGDWEEYASSSFGEGRAPAAYIAGLIERLGPDYFVSEDKRALFRQFLAELAGVRNENQSIPEEMC